MLKNNDEEKNCIEVRNIQQCEYVFKIMLTQLPIGDIFVRLLANRQERHYC